MFVLIFGKIQPVSSSRSRSFAILLPLHVRLRIEINRIPSSASHLLACFTNDSIDPFAIHSFIHSCSPSRIEINHNPPSASHPLPCLLTCLLASLPPRSICRSFASFIHSFSHQGSRSTAILPPLHIRSLAFASLADSLTYTHTHTHTHTHTYKPTLPTHLHS